MTMNGVMAIILRYFSKLGTFGRALRKVVQDIPKTFLRQKCRPKFLVFSDLSITMIRCTELRHRGD